MVRFHEQGPPEVLRYEEAPNPMLGLHRMMEAGHLFGKIVLVPD